MQSRGVYVRNLKAAVLSLPDREFADVTVPMGPEQSAAYERVRRGILSDLRSVDTGQFEQKRASFLARRASLLRMCSDPASVIDGYSETPAKDVALDELLDDLVVRRGEKVVLWSYYRATLDRLANRYSHLGLVRIDGSVADSNVRRAAVRSFQEDPGTMIFLGNPAAAGAGITLHSARTMIFESLSNQAAHHLQSLDRVHRRGQERAVRYITLLAEGTLEEPGYARLKEKAQEQARLLGDEISTPVTRELMVSELLYGSEENDGSSERWP
jgi:SNF2 family DNA or RNA helicase